MKGVIKNEKFDRGYCFLRPDDGSADVFAHIKDFQTDEYLDAGIVGRRAEFDIATTDRGPAARRVRLI